MAPASEVVVPPAMAPAGSIVALEITQAISTKTIKPGDRFTFRLAKPLMVGETIVAPAGTTGEGEVIHSTPGRLGGKAGELILAARFLTLDNHRVDLRSFRLIANGKDRSDAALALMLAGGLASPVGGVAAFLVKGGDIDVPVGAIAVAKLAADLIAAPSAAPAASTPQSANSTSGVSQ
jgi:hypothetical protein